MVLAGGQGMRILHAVRQYAPGIGGIESYVSQLAALQARAGDDVRVVTLDKIIDGDGKRLPGEETRNGVTVMRVPYRGSRRYPLAPRALRHFRETDIIHVHGVEFFADFAALTSSVHRKPLVLSTHGGIFHTRFAWHLKMVWFHTITRSTLRGYHSILASSLQDHGMFARIAGAKVKLVENAVDTERFAGAARPAATRMIYFGRLAPNKGLDALIRWFAAVHRLAPEWSLIIAGKEMGTQIASLRALCATQGIEHAVRFSREPDDATLRALIAECSTYVCASRFEGFGIAAVEAIGAGLFPVLSDIAPFRRTIERCGLGLCLDFASGETAREFLIAFAEQPAAPVRLRERLAAFHWDRVIGQTKAIYVEAMRAGLGAQQAIASGTSDGSHAFGSGHIKGDRLCVRD
jgi:alpha-1,3-mannosyltransferase